MTHSIQWEWVKKGHLQATQGFGIFPIILFHWAYLRPTSIIGKILPNSCLSEVGHDLGFILGCLPLHDAMNRAIRLLWLKSTSLARPGEKVSYPHPTSRSDPEAGNPRKYIIPFGAQTHWRVQGLLRGFTWAISVSAQNCLHAIQKL